MAIECKDATGDEANSVKAAGYNDYVVALEAVDVNVEGLVLAVLLLEELAAVLVENLTFVLPEELAVLFQEKLTLLFLEKLAAELHFKLIPCEDVLRQ